MKKTLPIFFLFFSSCFLFEDEQNTNLTLSLHSAGVTTVNLNISPEDSLAQFTFELTRDDSTVQTLSLQSDTLLKDTGLNPNTSYTYKGYWKNGTERIGESETLTVTTMDTTSHNFTWVIDTLGEFGSYLYDVTTIDENNIWVVGQIYTDGTYYNAAHWNGSKWVFYRIAPNGFFGRITSVFAFSNNDVWFGKYGSPIHYDGESFIKYTPTNGGHPGQPTIEAIWGTSPSDIYFVGYNGSIVHYNGSIFQSLASSLTDDNINDIWGVVDSHSGETKVYCVVTTLYEETEKRLLQIHPNFTVTDALDYNLDRSLMSVWFDETSPVYVGGSGFFQQSREDMVWQFVPDLPEYFVWDIDGNHAGDIMVVGAYGFAAHFNGMHWKVLEELQPFSSLKAVDIKDDVVAIIGRLNNVVLVGHRVN